MMSETLDSWLKQYSAPEEAKRPEEKAVKLGDLCANCEESSLVQHRRIPNVLVCPTCWAKYATTGERVTTQKAIRYGGPLYWADRIEKEKGEAIFEKLDEVQQAIIGYMAQVRAKMNVSSLDKEDYNKLEELGLIEKLTRFTFGPTELGVKVGNLMPFEKIMEVHYKIKGQVKLEEAKPTPPPELKASAVDWTENRVLITFPMDVPVPKTVQGVCLRMSGGDRDWICPPEYVGLVKDLGYALELRGALAEKPEAPKIAEQFKSDIEVFLKDLREFLGKLEFRIKYNPQAGYMDFENDWKRLQEWYELHLHGRMKSVWWHRKEDLPGIRFNVDHMLLSYFKDIQMNFYRSPSQAAYHLRESVIPTLEAITRGDLYPVVE